MDGHSLSRLMHKRGINLRYLGRLAASKEPSSPRLDALRTLAVQEMLARAFKHIVHKYLRQIPPSFSTSCIAHLLNCLLGSQLNDSPKVSLDPEAQSLYPESEWSFADLSPSSLQKQIEEEAHRRYRFDLAPDWISNIKHLQLLREIALKLGLQLTSKDYCFRTSDAPPVQQMTNGAGPLTNGTSNGHGKKKKKLANHDAFQASQESLVAAGPPVTFEADDIVNLVSIVKEASPKSSLAEEAFEAGKAFVHQDQKELGQELLLESLSLHEQIYGILHPEVARVYHQLATLYHQLHDPAAAVELARKAVLVSERTLGPDSAETVLAYLNLGFFEHAAGRSAAALRLVRHALDLWKLVHGAGLRHPDAVTTLNNAAVMQQQLRRFRASRRWFERSLSVCAEMAGPSSVAAATLRFQLAQALALDHEPQRAVAAMRDAYGAFRAQLGPADRNTKEAEAWLEQLTQNAVSIARHAKDVQSRRVRRVPFAPRGGAASAGPAGLSAARLQPPVGDTVGAATRARAPSASGPGANASALSQAAASGAPGPPLDARSLDELIRFIEGGPEAAKRSPGKKSARGGHPKRRGGAGGPVAASS